jgi:hypothetical protein
MNRPNKVFENGEWWYVGCKDGGKRRLSAHNKKNSTRMFVNGQYIPKSHPLHKPGRYIIDGFFGEALVEDDKSKAGYIYCITNPAWPGLVKVGKAVSVDKRFSSYQTYSPFRDFVLEWSVHVDDVHAIEAAFHRHYKEVSGEWYEMTANEARYLFNQLVPHLGGSNVANDNQLAQARVA